MDDDSLQLLVLNPAWLRVLLFYRDLAADSAARRENETGPRWCCRISALDELDPQELAAVHGRLIALGWLTFQLEDGQHGLSYRVSDDGRSVLARLEEPGERVASLKSLADSVAA